MLVACVVGILVLAMFVWKYTTPVASPTVFVALIRVTYQFSHSCPPRNSAAVVWTVKSLQEHPSILKAIDTVHGNSAPPGLTDFKMA